VTFSPLSENVSLHLKLAGVIVDNATRAVLIAIACLCMGTASAQSADTNAQEPVAVLEIGAVPTQSIKGGGFSVGPTVAVEVTPIENRLEIEGGTTALFAHHSTEWDTDVLFKKPWTFSPKAEFMLGAGPEWIHNRSRGLVTNSVGGEVALDFMFWPKAKHKFGWYLEPAYDYDFAHGRDQSIGLAGGLLIGISRKR
jgi:hypothetical protein